MDITNLIELDRRILFAVNGCDNLMLNGMMATLTSGWFWIPLYLSLFYIVIKNNETMGQIVLAVSGCLLAIVLAGGVDNLLVKPWIARLRPCNNPEIKYLINTIVWVGKEQYSFFSAHAANTFALACFLGNIFRHFYPKMLLWLLLWASIVSYSRIYLGVHYPLDVLTGLSIGILFGYGMYIFYKRIIIKNIK